MKRFRYLTLAVLAAFAACDEGGTGTPDVGGIGGTVTIEGTGVSGVTVSLSSGATTTTNAQGQYGFAEVETGSYTVSISGYPADATFSSTSQAAAITSAGQQVQVNFSGTYVRTSAIFGNVSAGGTPLANVNVSIGSQSTTTDANGQYSFSGLRAGSYTVTISAFDASKYVFAQTSQSVSVAAGESKVVSFSGQFTTTASIRGSLFIDENVKNDVFDSTEPALAAAGVTISLTTGTTTSSVQTAADGSFSFSNLAAGTYAVSISASDPNIPGNMAFGGATNQVIASVTAGAVSTVNWPFDILQQAISVYAFLGRDAVDPGQAPIKGWGIRLYDTDQHANAAGTTGLLGTVTTDAAGEAIFRFKRSDDLAPSGASDNIVYARYLFPLPANHAPNGEQIIEIKYNSTDSLGTAPDTFDALNSQVVVGVTGLEIDDDALENWIATLRQNDTLAAALAVGNMNNKGVTYFTVNGLVGALPNHLYARLGTAQAAANGHGFKVTLTGEEAGVAGQFLDYEWSGTVATGDTVMLGTATVKYTDSDIAVRIHREKDDSTDAPTYTKGDDFVGAGGFTGELFKVHDDGTVDPFSPSNKTSFPAPPATGELIFLNQLVDSTYQVEALVAPGRPELELITDSIAEFTLDGSDQVYQVAPLGTTKTGYATFALKFHNNKLSGQIKATDGTAVSSLRVAVAPTSDMIGTAWSGTVKTDGTGMWATPDSLLDGPYMVTVADSTTSSSTVWAFEKTLKTTSAPLNSGAANNTDAYSGVRDVAASGVPGDNKVTNFEAVRMNTQVRGLVVNDRDSDTNTIDPGEGLAGVSVKLYKDNSGTITVNADSLVAETTTGANGAYSFSNLREGQYVVKVDPATPNTSTLVLRSFLANTDTAHAKTAASNTCDGGGQNCRTVGSAATKIPLPSFDYKNSLVNNTGRADWTFLYFTGEVKGQVTLSGSGSAASGMNIQLQLCANTSWTPAATPVVPNTFTCTPSGAVVNGAADSGGNYSFTGLREGVYTVTAIPASVGSGLGTVQGILWILGSSDVQTVNLPVT